MCVTSVGQPLAKFFSIEQKSARKCCPPAGRPQRLTLRASAGPPAQGRVTAKAQALGLHPLFERTPCPAPPIRIEAGVGRETPWYTDLPKYYLAPRPDFPLTLQPTAQGNKLRPAAWGPWVRDVVENHLADHGAILLRHMPVHTGKDFTELMEAVGYPAIKFEGILVRRNTQGGERTYNTSTEPPSLVLVPHNEAMAEPAYTNDKIVFACLQPAPQGGETLLVPTRDLTEAIGAETLQLFDDNGGVRYSRWYPSPRQQKRLLAAQEVFVPPTWQQWTGEDTAAGALAYFSRRGWKNSELRFDQHSGLFCSHVRPATQSVGGEKLWLNIANLKGYGEGFQMTFGNGTPIPENVRQRLSNLRWLHAVAFPLERGDVLFIDNLRALHGRTPYCDTAEVKRTLVSYMTLGK
jgi:hypothetical protein